MKILLITGAFPELTFIFRMVTAIAERGHEVIVAARNQGDWKPFAEELPLDPGIKVRYLIPDVDIVEKGVLRFVRECSKAILVSPREALKLLRTCFTHPATKDEPMRHFFRHLAFLDLKDAGIDVVQYEFYIMKFMYPLLDDMLGAATLVSCRGADVHFYALNDETVQKKRRHCLLSATAIHCVSEEMTHAVTEITGRTHGLWVNRPAVEANKITAKDDYGANDVPMIVSVGRLYWKKGHDYLLASLYRLKQEGVPFKAQIIGDGELYSRMRFSIEDLGLTEQVELVGKLSPPLVMERLRHADIFVLSSHEEGISNAVLEAMATGLPVVTTTAGGMAEAVRDGIDGYVVPIRDVVAMTDRIKRLLVDPALREKMGRSGREQVEAEFTVERQARVFEQIYQSLVNAADPVPVEILETVTQ